MAASAWRGWWTRPRPPLPGLYNRPFATAPSHGGRFRFQTVGGGPARRIYLRLVPARITEQITPMWPLLLAWLAVAPEFDASLLDGRTVRGRVVGLSAAGVVLDTAAGRQSLPAAELAGLQAALAAAPSFGGAKAWVDLVDGTRLAAQSYLVHRGKAAVALVGGGEVSLPVGRVAAVRFKEQTDLFARQWHEIASNEQTGDVVVVRRQQALDFLTGIIGDVEEATVHFELEGERLEVRRSRIEGLIYFRPPEDRLPRAFCRLITASGQSIEVHKLELPAEAGAGWQVESPAGLRLELLPGEVTRIEFKVQYLSDLEPERTSWSDAFSAVSAIPVLAELYAPRRNRGFFSERLRLDGRTYAKGLALRSRSELLWRLPGTHRRLTALAGIDDELRPRGSVRLVIQGDARTLLDVTITGQSPALPIDLDISGVRRLLIQVDFGEDLDVADSLNLCDARLVD